MSLALLPYHLFWLHPSAFVLNVFTLHFHIPARSPGMATKILSGRSDGDAPTPGIRDGQTPGLIAHSRRAAALAALACLLAGRSCGNILPLAGVRRMGYAVAGSNLRLPPFDDSLKAMAHPERDGFATRASAGPGAWSTSERSSHHPELERSLRYVMGILGDAPTEPNHS